MFSFAQTPAKRELIEVLSTNYQEENKEYEDSNCLHHLPLCMAYRHQIYVRAFMYQNKFDINCFERILIHLLLLHTLLLTSTFHFQYHLPYVPIVLDKILITACSGESDGFNL